MKAIQIKNKALLYDGEENGYYDYTINFNIENKVLTSEVVDFERLFKLKDNISLALFDFILKEIVYTKGSLPDTFVGTDDLSLKFCFKKDNKTNKSYLIIISTGEFQPGRYKIYLEGVWLLE